MYGLFTKHIRLVCQSTVLATKFYHRHLYNLSTSDVYSSPTSYDRLHIARNGNTNGGHDKLSVYFT